MLITEHTDRLPNGDLRGGRKKLIRQRILVRRPFVSPIMWGKEKWRKRKTKTKSEEGKKKREKKRGNELGTSIATCEMAPKHEQPVAVAHHYKTYSTGTNTRVRD